MMTGNSRVALLAMALAAFAVGCGPDTIEPDQLSGRIAFTGFRDGNAEIYVADLATGVETRLTSDPAQDFDPDWSPDGARIAFISTRGGDSALHVMNADGSGVARLTTPTIGEQDPAWSGDGSRIVFTRGKELYTVRADGTDLTPFVPDFSAFAPAACRDFYEPTWSGDGRFLVFLSGVCVGGPRTLYRANADGSGVTELIAAGDGPIIVQSPDLTSTGSSLVYTVSRPDRPEFVVSLNIGSPDSLRAAEPVWSPDADFVAFVVERFGLEAPGELFVIAADGTGATPLGIARADSPAWSR